MRQPISSTRATSSRITIVKLANDWLMCLLRCVVDDVLAVVCARVQMTLAEVLDTELEYIDYLT